MLVLEGDFDDGIDCLGDRWQGNGRARCRGRVAQVALAVEQAHLADALGIERNEQGIVVEVEDVQIQGVAALGGHAPIMRWNDAATGAVDALAILAHPLAQGMQTLDGLGGQTTIGTWPHVDEQVAIAPSGLDQCADDVVGALVVLVGDAVAPGAVHGHAGLQRQLADAVLARVAGGVLARHVLLKYLYILAGEGNLVVVVADETGGLQAVDEGILLVELPVKGHRVGVVLPRRSSRGREATAPGGGPGGNRGGASRGGNSRSAT